MRHRADHVYVMRDEQVTQAALALQLLQKRQHLLLDRRVERAGGFVQNQSLGVHDQCASDRQALALAAGEFMGIALQQIRKLRLIQPHFLQSSENASLALRRLEQRFMNAQTLAHDLFDRHTRRER